MKTAFALKGFSPEDQAWMKSSFFSLFIKSTLVISAVCACDCIYLIAQQCGWKYLLSFLGSIFFLYMMQQLAFTQSGITALPSKEIQQAPRLTSKKNEISVGDNKRKFLLASTLIILFIALFHAMQLYFNSLCNTLWCYGYRKDSQYYVWWVQSNFPVVCSQYQSMNDMEQDMIVEYNVTNQKQIEKIHHIPANVHHLIGGAYVISSVVWTMSLIVQVARRKKQYNEELNVSYPAV